MRKMILQLGTALALSGLRLGVALGWRGLLLSLGLVTMLLGGCALILATAIGVTLSEVTDWEMGRAEPGVSRMRVLAEHFDVRDDEINLRPGQEPTLGERLADAL